MTTWVIGDVQGCNTQFQSLLEVIEFDRRNDCLWLVGDLVNRGPESLAVLRFAYALNERIRIVLGNHDLHLLAASVGARKISRADTLTPILEAPDRDELLDWLRQQPLVYHDAKLEWTMVHAGIPPIWSVGQAVKRSAEVEARLQSGDWKDLMHQMYGDSPAVWDDRLVGAERLRYIINAFTRMRYLDASGQLDFKEKKPPGQQSLQLYPWYELRANAGLSERVVFGHWATLQTRRAIDPRLTVRHVDHGCVWGGRLVAYSLESGVERSVAGLNKAGQNPKP